MSSVGAYNPGRGIWGGMGGSRGSGQGRESLISTFACFLTAAAKVLFLEGRLGTGVMSPPKFEILLIFPYFLRP